MSVCFLKLNFEHTLISTGKTDDAKVSEKGSVSTHSTSIQRSPSDAGRSSGDEALKKPSSSASSSSSTTTPSARIPTSTFGFKKPGGAMVTTGSITMVTASGATITSGSATLGKIPKSAGLAVGGRGSALKGSVDGTGIAAHEDGYLSSGMRSTLQYRSLPRPSRSGAAARNGNRSSTSSIESGLSARAPGLSALTGAPSTHSHAHTHTTSAITIATAASKPCDAPKSGSNTLPANQTDREKGASELDPVRAALQGSGGGAATMPQTARQQSSKYAEVSSPTLRR